jgi:hypothetical protein
LTLPTNINGATVTWSSGNEKLVTASGEVTRPKGRDAKVVLHATITKGAATASRDITVRVVKAFRKATDQAYLFVRFTFSDEKIYLVLAQTLSRADNQSHESASSSRSVSVPGSPLEVITIHGGLLQ